MLYFTLHICEYFSIKTIYIPHNVWYNKDSKRAAAQTETAQPGRRILCISIVRPTSTSEEGQIVTEDGELLNAWFENLEMNWED